METAAVVGSSALVAAVVEDSALAASVVDTSAVPVGATALEAGLDASFVGFGAALVMATGADGALALSEAFRARPDLSLVPNEKLSGDGGVGMWEPTGWKPFSSAM